MKQNLPQKEFMLDNFIEGIGLAVNEAVEKGGTREEIAGNILERISFYCGGLNLYIPKLYSAKIASAERNNAIKQEFNGKNHAYLAFKYGLSLQYIYRIVKGEK